MKVSVAMFAYNHEAYLAQALDSVLAQRVNFDYEIVLGEDCSTDGTREIALRYQADHPDRVRLLLHEKNIGAWKNNEAVLDACRGEYIAFLDGDDYWTHPEKLARQAALMDEHPDCATCGHQVRVWPDHEPEDLPTADWTINPPAQKTIVPFQALLRNQFLPSCSLMMRSNRRVPLPPWSIGILNCDWIRCILVSNRRQIGFINEVMATYRVHNQSIWNGRDARVRLDSEVRSCRELCAHVDREYHGLLKQRIADAFRRYGWWALRDGDFRLALSCGARAIWSEPASSMGWRLMACTLLNRRSAAT